MVVGLGTGTTATAFIRERAVRKLVIRCVASSDASHDLARSLGMQVATLDELPELDIYIDGADEICQCGSGLDLIKGGGGALLREKIVASAAREFVVVADDTKLVKMLGKFPLPVGVIKMALPLVEPKLAALGFKPKLRMKKGTSPGLKPLAILAGGNAGTEVPAYPEGAASAKAEGLSYPETNDGPSEMPEMNDGPGGSGEPFVTDEGNYILDCWSMGIAEPESTAAEIRSIVGVVEHGLFLRMATLALVGGEDGVKEFRG